MVSPLRAPGLVPALQPRGEGARRLEGALRPLRVHAGLADPTGGRGALRDAQPGQHGTGGGAQQVEGTE